MGSNGRYELIYFHTRTNLFIPIPQNRKVPIFLVGTKADLGHDRAVSERERIAKAKQWETQSFEVSAKTNTGVANVFNALIEEILNTSGNLELGSGGGSVMGAGSTAGEASLISRRRKRCNFL